MDLKWKTNVDLCKVDIDQVITAAQADDSIGICTECGFEQDSCEPDARQYECQNCGHMTVFGAQELAIMLF